MVKTIKKEAKSVEEAIRMAAEELGVAAERIQVKILEEGKSGILGFGSKHAIIEASYEESIEDKITAFLQPIFESMGIAPDMIFSKEEDQLHVKMDCENSGIAIGRRGETLDALQYLTSLVVNREAVDYTRIIMDVSDYRLKREETLVGLAQRVAEKVMKGHRSVTLEPMNPYERRIIHSSLQEFKEIETYSVGEEPYRKVVVRSTKGGDTGRGGNADGYNRGGSSDRSDNRSGGGRNQSYGNRAGSGNNSYSGSRSGGNRNGNDAGRTADTHRAGTSNRNGDSGRTSDTSRNVDKWNRTDYSGSASPINNPNSYRNRSTERIGYAGNPTASGSVLNPDAPVYKPFDIEDEIGKIDE